MPQNIYQSIIILFLVLISLNGCGKIGGVDAKKFPPDPKDRVKNNIEQGKGFRLVDKIKGSSGNTNFEFASSNELWRASLDIIDLKIFYKICKDLNNCSVNERTNNLAKELKKEILKKATIYKEKNKDKNFKPYKGNQLK